MFTFFARAKTPRRIYLDHAASTPTRPEVVEAMLPYLAEHYGNPSAIHAEGREAKAAVEQARANIAKILGVRPPGVVFTSGGTEANALAIVGYLTHLHTQGRDWASMEVVSTAIEHPSVVRTLESLMKLGVTVRTVAVDAEGFITPATLQAALTPRTVLVTFAYVNSEIGTVQRVHALARVLRTYEREQQGGKIALHVDAAQAPLWLSCDLPRLDADLLTLDGAKCGGPKGVGVLAMRKHIDVQPLLQGGGQEAGHRPGTENVAGIVGMQVAVEIAQQHWEERAKKVAMIRDYALTQIAAELPTALINGASPHGRVANNINISFLMLDTEYAVVVLDAAGIAASTKSACSGAGSGVSTVVQALYGDLQRARSTLRLTLGEETTKEEIDQTVAVLKAHLAKMAELT